MDRFETLLADLGSLIDIPLKPNSLRSCYFMVNHQLHIEMKEDDAKQGIRIATFIAEVPPGKFREKIFLETLKEHGKPPIFGVFSYSPRNNQLALCSYLYFNGLQTDSLAHFLDQFLEKAFSWQTAISTGQIPEKGQSLKRSGPSIFDVQKK